MALPVILVDSATGSDTAASGAGPSTALTGSAASFVTATVTLSGSPDLTNVAVDGSHVLFLLTTTGVVFFKITAKNAGAFTVDVTPNPAGTASGLTWAIGGKRATLIHAQTKKLFDSGGGAGDAMPGWIVEMASGHAETIAGGDYRFQRSGDTTNGPITLRGVSGAATKPILTLDNDGIGLFPVQGYISLKDFELRNTAAGKTASVGIRTNLDTVAIEGIKVDHATNYFFYGMSLLAGALHVSRCRIGYTASHGINHAVGSGISGQFVGNYIHHCGGAGLMLNDSFVGLMVRRNTIYACTGIGLHINFANSASGRGLVEFNNIVGGSADGIRVSAALLGHDGLAVENNIIGSNGGYGLNFADMSLAFWRASGIKVRNNAFRANSSGNYSPAVDSENDVILTGDPFTNAAGEDFSLNNTAGAGAACRGTGFPSAFPT